MTMSNSATVIRHRQRSRSRKVHSNIQFLNCWKPRWLSFIALFALLLVSLNGFVCDPTFAQGSDDPDPDRMIIAPANPSVEKAGRDGIRAQRAGDDAGAVILFTRAIALLGPNDPVMGELYLLRGASYRRLGQLNEALHDVDEAVKFPTMPPAVHYSRGMVLMSMRRYEEALAAFDNYLARGTKNALVYRQRGLALSELGRFPEEVAAFDAALQLAPNNTSLLYHRAVANTEAGNIDAAIADYTQCINLDPKPMVYYGRGNLYDRQKNYEAAVADFSHALELDPKMVRAYNNRGNAYADLGRPEAALADYTMAIKLDPKHVSAFRNRGLLYASQGRDDLARADYEQGLKLAPDDPWLKEKLKNINSNQLK